MVRLEPEDGNLIPSRRQILRNAKSGKRERGGKYQQVKQFKGSGYIMQPWVCEMLE